MNESSAIAAPPAAAVAAPPWAEDASESAARLPGLSIVLPCFNEEANVADAIRYATAAAAAAAPPTTR